MAEIYRWQALDASGQILPGAPAPEFPTQADAEAWLSQDWEVFVDAGASSVLLTCEGEVVYGPMSLAAPE